MFGKSASLEPLQMPLTPEVQLQDAGLELGERNTCPTWKQLKVGDGLIVLPLITVSHFCCLIIIFGCLKIVSLHMNCDSDSGSGHRVCMGSSEDGNWVASPSNRN